MRAHGNIGRSCRAIAALFVAIASLSARASENRVRIYIANDDHTDYMWSADEEAYREAFISMLEYYMDRAEATADRGRKNQAKFNADGSYWFWEYERSRGERFERLMRHFRQGTIVTPMTPLILCYGAQGVESVLRGLYYAGRLERRYGVRFLLAQPMENQTQPYGVASLWAGAGARYCWNGVCACASPVRGLEKRPHELYWWTGPDGSRILTKWYNFSGSNGSLGGYAEMRDRDIALLRAKAKAHGGIAGGFGWGWDEIATKTTWFEEQAQAAPDVYLSNELDFYEDVEKTLGDRLPAYGASFGNDWDLLAASIAEVTARVKRSAERLRAAEALATLVALKEPGFLEGRDSERDRAFMDLGLYFEHDLTADGPIPREKRLAWQRRKMESIERYSKALLSDAASALSRMIAKTGTRQRFFVFNPLSWPRTDVADLPYNGPGPVHAVEVGSGREAPSELRTAPGGTYLRVLAREVPPVGYKVFEVRPGAGSGAPAVPADPAAGTISNEHYALKVNRAGAIVSLRDKRLGDREFAAGGSDLRLNDFGSQDGALSLEHAGPVSATLCAEALGKPAHRTRITLYRELDRVEIANEIAENFGSTHHWCFAWNLSEPDSWHEEVGAVIRAKTLDAGGHYAPGPGCVRHEYQTLNHFVYMGGSGDVGVILSNWDCAFMKLGESTLASLDSKTPRFQVLAGGRVCGGSLGIPDQGGDAHFLQRFAIRTCAGPFDAAAAMRFALEHQNPLVAAPVEGGSAYPAAEHSLLEISDPAVLLWALKPAEEGIRHGAILRVWNLATRERTFAVRVPAGAIESAKRTTHIETDIADANVVSGALSESIPGNAIRTYRIHLKAGGG